MKPHLHLKKVDPVLGKIIARIKLPDSKPHTRYFEALCTVIISQQLSTKAAASIKKKFLALFGNKFPTSEQVLGKSSKQLRAVGLSFQKIGYIKNLAKLVKNKKVSFNQFKKLGDEQIIEVLIQAKGIGRWTAEMFLMFCLGRPDVFSHGDLGLKNAIRKLYKLDQKLHSKKYHALVESWRPHRTIAARYLWASLSNQ